MSKQDNKPKDLSDVVGLPDKEDKRNILTLIKNYEIANPGQLKHTLDSARNDMKSQGDAKYGVVSEQAGRRLVFELPEGLILEIEKAYPLMFRDKNHFRWFVKNFKPLMIPDRY